MVSWFQQKPLGAYLRLMRLHQPTGAWLLFWPCAWGLALASSWESFDWRLFAIFLLGSFVMRAAGCIINDMADRRIDAEVERTKNRPLANGELSMRQAGMLLAGLLLIGAALLFQLNHFSILIGLASLPLMAAYPFMKRITRFPQAFLGLTFNWGALVGWAAVKGTLDGPAWLLYAAGVFWTLGYDTIYALQDKKDDERIGVKSTAITFGDRVMLAIPACYAAMFALILFACRAVGKGWFFWLGLVIVVQVTFWYLKKLDPNDRGDCLRKFRTNGWLGGLIFLVLLAS